MLKHFTNSKIPIWVNIMQIILILIMLAQVVGYFFDPQAMADAGHPVDSVPMKNLVYEMGSRLLTMVVAAIFVLITQNPQQYLVVLIMNVFRESSEGIIDPLFPLANAPMSPAADFWAHVVIVAIEVLALVVVLRIVRKEDKAEAPQAAMT